MFPSCKDAPSVWRRTGLAPLCRPPTGSLTERVGGEKAGRGAGTCQALRTGGAIVQAFNKEPPTPS